VTAWAITVGVVAGAAVVLLVVATLARAGVPATFGAIRTAVHLDLAAATAGIAVLGLAITVVIIGYAGLIARDAATVRSGRPGAARRRAVRVGAA
jgi:hypothetical protein